MELAQDRVQRRALISAVLKGLPQSSELNSLAVQSERSGETYGHAQPSSPATGYGLHDRRIGVEVPVG
jgi:hypothetical protein